MLFDIVKRYFEKDIYSASDVSKFVQAGKISEAQYQEITGLVYPETE